MKVKLIYPKVAKKSIEVFLPYLWFPLLTFPVLAAYTPADVDVEIIDETIQEIDFDDPVDLVGLTAFTYTAARAYEIAAEYRRRGVKVVMGGFHASAVPDEAKEHVDAVVIGEGEETWPAVIHDFKSGNLQPFYKSQHLFDMKNYKRPRLDLLSRYCPSYENYTPPFYPTLNIIEMTRGCPFECDFCAVTNFYGKKYRARPIDDVLAEIRTLKLQSRQRYISFSDDNIYGSKSYFRELLEGLRKLNIQWGGQVGIDVARDPDVLAMMADSGCRSVGIGIESLDQDSLKSIHKLNNKVDEYDYLFDQLNRHRIKAYIGMMVGLDHDDESIFERTLDWVNRHLDVIIFANFHILTPLPGTALYKKLLDQDRLIDFDWNHYDTKHLVFKPRAMSPGALENGYKWLMEKIEPINLTNWKKWF